MKQKQDKYNYVSHPRHLPLEVDGRAKKRSIVIRKEEYNGEQGSINEDSRALLRKKLEKNIHELGDMRSVVPGGNQRKRSRPNSIKTFNQNKENITTSGVEYLMQRTESLKQSQNKGRAHIPQFMPNDPKRPQKKHYGNINTEGSEAQPALRNHKQTVEVRIANDIYSNVYRAEPQINPAKKIQPSNLFRNGLELGLEQRREKKVSERKLVELLGSDLNKSKCLKEKRQDWRISNVTFF